MVSAYDDLFIMSVTGNPFFVVVVVDELWNIQLKDKRFSMNLFAIKV